MNIQTTAAMAGIGLKGAVAGAVAGSVAGGIVGAVRDDVSIAQGAAVGAGIGGLGGASVSYLGNRALAKSEGYKNLYSYLDSKSNIEAATEEMLNGMGHDGIGLV